MEEIAGKLREELDDRGKFYFKGFGMILQDLCANLEIFDLRDKSEQIKAHVLARINRLVELYGSVSLDETHPDFELLSEIKGAVFMLREKVFGVLAGNILFSEAHEVIVQINEKGNRFRKRIQNLLKELRSHEGCEKEVLRVTDVIDGRVWEFSHLK